MERFREKTNLYKNGKLSYLKFYSSFISYLGHLEHTNSNKIKIKIISFYLCAITSARKQCSAVKRGGNWNNGANAGLFYANLNNAPSNSNTNIGFRCCSENQADALFSRKYCQPDIHQLLLSSYDENMSRNKAVLTDCNFCDEKEDLNI